MLRIVAITLLTRNRSKSAEGTTSTANARNASNTEPLLVTVACCSGVALTSPSVVLCFASVISIMYLLRSFQVFDHQKHLSRQLLTQLYSVRPECYRRITSARFPLTNPSQFHLVTLVPFEARPTASARGGMKGPSQQDVLSCRDAGRSHAGTTRSDRDAGRGPGHHQSCH